MMPYRPDSSAGDFHFLNRSCLEVLLLPLKLTHSYTYPAIGDRRSAFEQLHFLWYTGSWQIVKGVNTPQVLPSQDFMFRTVLSLIAQILSMANVRANELHPDTEVEINESSGCFMPASL
jgi:hypothetical protein